MSVYGKLVKNPYKNWNEIDKSLPAVKIEILVAPPTSGTRDAWDELVMGKGCDPEFMKLTDKKKEGFKEGFFAGKKEGFFAGKKEGFNQSCQ